MVVVGRPYGTLHRDGVAHGITRSGRNALPDRRCVWNPSSFTVTSSVNVNMVWCRVRLPLRPEPRSLVLIKLLKMPNQVASTGWSKFSISKWDMTVWWGFNVQDKEHCANKVILTEMKYEYEQQREPRPGASVNPKKLFQPFPPMKTGEVLIRPSEPDETPCLAGP